MKEKVEKHSSKQAMAEEKRMQWRIWWPMHLNSLSNSSTESFVVGWIVHGVSNSVDIVVATTVPFQGNPNLIPSIHLKDAVNLVQTKLPISLQDRSNLAIIGQCRMSTVCSNSNNDTGKEHDLSSQEANSNANGWSKKHAQLKSSSFCKGDQNLGVSSGTWIDLHCQLVKLSTKEQIWIPKQLCLYQERVTSVLAIHTVLYEQPRFGSHHFSYKSWMHLALSSADRLHDLDFSSTPQWMKDLDQKKEPSNFDHVLSLVNSSATVEILVQEALQSLGTSCKRISFFAIIMRYIWKAFATIVAIAATVFYIIIRLVLNVFTSQVSSILNIVFSKVFKLTWVNVRIRCGQIMHWSSLLLENGFWLQPNVSVAHHSAILRHSLWSMVVFDICFGTIFGFLLLKHSELVSTWVVQLTQDITNHTLRSGCVWLMGVPAGFKLNTELSEILGMLSLTAIQVWATLWFLVQPFIKYIINVLALCGFFLGFTIQAALIRDILFLLTLHISILHWFLALIYAYQIHLLAALMRLFRGRKWNPLRVRIDSYDYTVDQHVVGSLIFTPLLLILPTTSVFYIFFTILTSTNSLVCMGLQLLISILHYLPYSKIALWLLSRRRFPSGVWLQVMSEVESSHSRLLNTTKVTHKRFNGIETTPLIGNIGSKQKQETPDAESITKCQIHATSVLGSNFANLGEIIFPDIRKAFVGFSYSSSAACVHKVFSGGRIPSSLEIAMPSPLPWFSISFKEFWWLTYEALLVSL